MSSPPPPKPPPPKPAAPAAPPAPKPANVAPPPAPKPATGYSTQDSFQRGPAAAPLKEVNPPPRTTEEVAARDLKARFSDRIKTFAQDRSAFGDVMKQAYPEKADELEVERLRKAAEEGRFPQPQNLRFVDRELLRGRSGAYTDANDGTVYLDRGLLADQRALDRVYAEEVGHHLDRQGKDSPGDEGEIFAEGLEKRRALDREELERARRDRDQDTIEVDGERRSVEFSDGPVLRQPPPGAPNGFPPNGPQRGGPIDLRDGGLPNFGPGAISPTKEEVQAAIGTLERHLPGIHRDLSSNDPRTVRDAYGQLRDLQMGAALLRDRAMGRGFELIPQIDQLRGNVQGQSLQHFPRFLELGGNGFESLDDMAARAAYQKHPPIDAPAPERNFESAMWERLQQPDVGGALKKEVEGARRLAEQRAETAKKSYQAALFEADAKQRAMQIEALEKNGGAYWKHQADELKAGEAGYAYRDGKRDLAAHRELVDRWTRLGEGGNDVARRAAERVGAKELVKDLESANPKLRESAQARIDAVIRDFQDRRWTERSDHILHGLTTDSALPDLTKARERLAKEVELGSKVAKRPLDRVTVQENLTGLAEDPAGASERLRKLSDEGNPLARESLRKAFLSPEWQAERAASGDGRPPLSTYAPIPLDRDGSEVKVPRLEKKALETVKVEAAKALGNKSTREDARALADVNSRFWASPVVQYEAKRSLEKGLAEKNPAALEGITDVVVEKTERDKYRDQELGQLFAKGRHLQNFDGQLARTVRAADAGSERAVDALVATVPNSANASERRQAHEAERALSRLAKTGRADRVTEALLEVPKDQRGEGPSYYRALGNGAAERPDTIASPLAKRWRQTDDVMATLRDGLSSNSHQPGLPNTHDGAADGMAAMAKHWRDDDARALSNNLSPPVLDAIEKGSDRIPKDTADTLRRSLRDNIRFGSKNDKGWLKEQGLLSAEALGRLGKHATAEDVQAIHDGYKTAEDNTRPFGALVNILSRTDTPEVKKATLDALWSKDAVWKTGMIDADTRKRLIDYVSGAGDPVLSNDINKLVYDLGIRPPVAGLWHSWGVGSPADAQRKALAARSHYGDDAARKLGARVDLWNRLSPEARADVLGYDRTKLTEQQKAQVEANLSVGWAADRMASGTLHDSSAKHLLSDLEGRTKKLGAERSEEYRGRNREAAALARERSDHLAELTKTTKGGVGFFDDVGHVFSYLNPRNVVHAREKTKVDEFEKQQNEGIGKLKEYDAKVEAKGREVADAARNKLFLDSALSSYDYRRELSEGRVKEADLIALDQWKEHGDSLKQLNPDMHQALHQRGKGAREEGAWQRLQRQGLVKLDAAPEIEGNADQRFKKAAEILRAKPEGAERAAVVKQALGVMDQDPALVEMTKSAGLLSRDLPTIQRMLQAGMEGRKYDGYVDEVRARAEPLRQEIDRLRADTKLMGQVDERISQLRDVEGKLQGDEKHQVSERIKALEGMRDLVKNDGVKNVLDTVMSDKFEADTWANWAQKDGPKMLGALAVGVAAAGLTVATFGTAAPLAAIAVAGVVGGMVGYEATAEGLHFMRHNFDEDVMSGKKLYTDRSKIGAKVAGEKIFDPETGTFRDREWWKDVGKPYGEQFLTDFAVTYATMGLGNGLARGINKLGASVINKLAGNPAAARMAGNMAQIEGVLGKEAARKTLGSVVQNAAKQFPHELADEMKDEVAGKFLEKGLEKIDPRLGMISNVLLATGKGVRLDVPSNSQFRFDGKYSADVRTALETAGYKTSVDPAKPGTIRVDTGDGPVFWQAHDGTAPSAADWKQLAEAKPHDPSATLPMEFNADPKIRQERAEAADQLAARLEKDLKAGELPNGKTKADLEAEIEQQKKLAADLRKPFTPEVEAGWNAAEKKRYDDNVPKEKPLAHMRAQLENMPLPHPTDAMKTFADLPSVKRTLARLEALEKSGAITSLDWAQYTPTKESHWAPAKKEMKLYNYDDPLETIAAAGHELTHVAQNGMTYRDGMTRDQFIKENSERALNGEVQTYRVQADMWREMMDHGLPKDKVPAQIKQVMEMLDKPDTSARKKREALKEYIAKDLGYQKSYTDRYGSAYDQTVGKGDASLLTREMPKLDPPPGARRDPSQNGGRGPAKPLPLDDPRVIDAKTKHGLDGAQTARFAQMRADLDRVSELAKKDPQAALRELQEMSKSKEWKDAKLGEAQKTQISEATLRSIWKDMEAYQRPDGMTMEQLGYLWGRDEGAFRDSKGGFGIPPKPADMPQPVYDAIVRGFQHEHAVGALKAYQQAAGDLVKTGMGPLGPELPDFTLKSVDKSGTVERLATQLGVDPKVLADPTTAKLDQLADARKAAKNDAQRDLLKEIYRPRLLQEIAALKGKEGKELKEAKRRVGEIATQLGYTGVEFDQAFAQYEKYWQAAELLDAGKKALNLPGDKQYQRGQELAKQADEAKVSYRAVNPRDLRNLLSGNGIPASGVNTTANAKSEKIAHDASAAYRDSAFIPATSKPPYLVAGQGPGTNFVVFDTETKGMGFVDRDTTARDFKDSQADYRGKQYTEPVAHTLAKGQIPNEALLGMELGGKRYDPAELKALIDRVQKFDQAFVDGDSVGVMNERGDVVTMKQADFEAAGLTKDALAALQDGRGEVFFDPATKKIVFAYLPQ